MQKLSPKSILKHVDELLQKEIRPCPNPQEHAHIGRVDCHPAPPAPGSYHKNPNIRHDFSFPGHGSSDPESPAANINTNPTLDKLKTLYREDVIHDDADRAALVGVVTRFNQNKRLLPQDEQLLNRMSSKYMHHLPEVERMYKRRKNA